MVLLACPVCGKVVDTSRTDHKVRHDNQLFFLCSAACAQRFSAEPEAYRGGNQRFDQQGMPPKPS